MKKEKSYPLVRFSADRLKDTFNKWLEVTPKELPIRNNDKKISIGNQSLDYDTDSEFFADLRKDYDRAEFFKTKFESAPIYQFIYRATRYESSLKIGRWSIKG